MKRSLLVVLVLMLVFGLVACGNTEDRARKDSASLDAEQESVDPDIQAIKDAGILRVGVKKDVPGFGLLNPSTEEYEGLEIDMAHKIAGLLLGDESKVEFTAVTAETRGVLLDNGQIDMVIATFTITPDRLQQWNFSDPYYQDSVGLLVEKKSGFSSFTDLDGKTIGVAVAATSKDAVLQEADKLGIKVSFVEYQNNKDISNALKSGEVDAFAIDRAILRGYQDDTRELLPESFNPQNYGIATKKTNTALAAFVNDFIIGIKTDGTLAELLEQHNL